MLRRVCAQVTAAILGSTANVTRLWIVCNGSPHLEIFRAKTAHLKAESTRVQVDFFGSSMEVGYFERFLRVLVADTKYIAVVDEDIVIGHEFLSLCVRALNTRKFYGVLGWHGRNFVSPSKETDAKYLRGMRMDMDGRQAREGGHIFGDEYGFVTPHNGM